MSGKSPAGAGGRRVWRGRIALLLAGICVGLLGVETAVRRWYRDDVDTEALRRRAEQGYIGTLVRPVADPDLVYELRPGLNAEWRGVVVATSNDGDRRVSTLPAAPRDRALRVAVLGDSTAFGWGVFFESTYAEAFGEKLAQALGVAVDVRNYSVPGYGSRQELAAFRTKVAPWKPDLLILHYDHNDAEPRDAVGPDLPPPEFGDNLLGSALVKLVRRRVFIAMHRRGARLWPGREDKVMEMGEGYSYRYGGPDYDAHLGDLAALGREAEALGIPLAAVVWECLLKASDDPHATPYHRLLVEPVVRHLRRNGFAVLSLSGAYQELMRSNGWTDLRPLWSGETDAHPTPRGHALIAGWLFEFVIREPGLLRGLEAEGRALSRGAMETTGGAAAAAYRRGLLQADQGLHEAAVASFVIVLRDYPDDVAVRLNLGRALRAAGRPREAVEEWQRVLALRPDSVLARLELGPALHELGGTAAAQRYLVEAAELASDKSLREAADYWLSELFGRSSGGE